MTELPPLVFPGAPPPFGDRVRDQLLARRRVLLDGAIDLERATLVCAQLMTLDADGDDAVTLIVNSQGGSLDAVFSLLDTIDLVECAVDTTCLGQASGTAVAVVAAGTGRRTAAPMARFALRVADQAVEPRPARQLSEDAAAMLALHDEFIDRVATATGQDRQLVARDIERGRVLSASEAVAYGLVDAIATKSPAPRAP